MNLLIWVCLTQAVMPQALGIYHQLSIEEFGPPRILPNDSYFGYSITYDQQFQRLVISAPKENNIGEVYDCDIKGHNCTAIIKTNIRRISPEYTNDYWFGATVKAGPDFVMMCAPRYTDLYSAPRKVKNTGTLKGFGTYGKCFKHKNGQLNETRPINKEERKNDAEDILEATMDSFGWSIDVASDDSVIVGGPGMYHGRAMIYLPGKQVPKFMQTNSKTPTFNFGYGVSSGTFFNEKLSFAVGSTYGQHGFGQVSIFKDNLWQARLEKQVDTQVVGSMFGAVLCSAKLSGYKTDLLVGAPTYASKSTYNLGAVYVYTAVKGNNPPSYRRKIVGEISGSLFGSAIISLGDLNGDRKDEIAIGAPFENDGRGAVYLYSGADLVSTKTEKTLKWLQKIEPEPHMKYAYSFGMSLTALLDYDGNGCNELAIGAPYKDSVVLLRCMSAVTVTASATFPNLQNRTMAGRSEFEFDVCLKVDYPSKPNNITALLETKVDMSHTHARLKEVDDAGAFTFSTSLHDKQREYCKRVPFTLPVNGNYETEISYQTSTTLLDNPLLHKEFDSSRVILTDRSVLAVQDSIWAAECSGNKECVPELAIKSFFSYQYTDHYYITGTSETEWFEIKLQNSGEVAYDACLRVHIVGALVFQPPASCERMPSTDGDTLLCRPTNPLRTDSEWATGHIVLEMTHLTNLDRDIKVNVTLYNRCKYAATKILPFVTPVRADPNGIFVKGITDIGDIVNMTKDAIQIDGKQMKHVYTISNNGLSNWAGLTAKVAMQKKPYIAYDDEVPVKVYVSTSNSYSPCLLDSKNEEWLHLNCKIDSLLAKRQVITIVIPMNIVPGTLDDILEDGNVTVSSKIILVADNYEEIQESIVSIIRLQDAVVPLWVIICATIVGLAIILIIAFILYECGFLQREKKKELEKLRKSVRRQTIMRRSTMPTQAHAEDRRQILERTTEENEDLHHDANNRAGPN